MEDILLPIPKFELNDIVTVNFEELKIIDRELVYNYDSHIYNIYYVLVNKNESGEWNTQNYKKLTEQKLLGKPFSEKIFYLKFEQEEIENICKKYNVQCSYYKHDIYITTEKEQWWVTRKRGHSIQLWHQNYLGNVHQYHFQKYFNHKKTSFEDIVKYIVKHKQISK